MTSASVRPPDMQRPWLVRALIVLALALTGGYAIRAPGHWAASAWTASSSSWKLGRATSLLAGCFIYWAVSDTIYALQTANGTYVTAGILDLGWVVPFALFGVAAWMRPDPRAVAARRRPSRSRHA